MLKRFSSWGARCPSGPLSRRPRTVGRLLGARPSIRQSSHDRGRSWPRPSALMAGTFGPTPPIRADVHQLLQRRFVVEINGHVPGADPACTFIEADGVVEMGGHARIGRSPRARPASAASAAHGCCRTKAPGRVRVPAERITQTPIESRAGSSQSDRSVVRAHAERRGRIPSHPRQHGRRQAARKLPCRAGDFLPRLRPRSPSSPDTQRPTTTR